MITVLAVLLLLVVIWLILLSIDTFRCKKKQKRRSPWCLNFTVRFCYEFFLEFCICAALQLSVIDFEHFSPHFQFWIAVAVTCCIIALIVFTVVLCYKSGPWVSGYFVRGTALSSYGQVRPVQENFDLKAYLKEHPKPKIKPWGHFIISFELCRCFKKKSHGEGQTSKKDLFYAKSETERGLFDDLDSKIGS